MERFLEICSIIPPGARPALWRPEFFETLRDDPADERRIVFSEARGGLLDRMQQLDIRYYLPGDILTKVDIASMAHSLECRVPLLDTELYRVARAIPESLRLPPAPEGEAGAYVPKWILKRLCANRFGDDFVTRPKMGFSIPLMEWCPRMSGADVPRLPFGEDSPFFTLFRAGGVKAAFAGVENNNAWGVWARWWAFVMLEEWLRTHPESLSHVR